MKGLVVAGTQSGAGKTTVSLALMAAFKRRGLEVQAFKVGPDFIDPGHHTLVTGRASRNLDGWMLSREENRAVFQAASQGAQVAVVEGVMGLYDGYGVKDGAGSTAQMAKILGLPVVLVAGARSLAASFAALVGGFLRFDPDLDWAGVIANQTGGPAHDAILAEALEMAPEARLLGCLPRDGEISLPERHLGLVTADEGGFTPEIIHILAKWVEDNLDLDALLESLPELDLGSFPERTFPAVWDRARVPVAVARDQAFCFYYQDNLDRLEQAGAEPVFFSPLESSRLPGGVRGLYLGGGYPELFAEKLSGQRELLQEIAFKGREGLPIYAECGGMMCLGKDMEDLEGKTWPMAGLLDLRTRMLKRLSSLGYREVEFQEDTPLGRKGWKARGHEFHYSEIWEQGTDRDINPEAYRVSSRKGTRAQTHGYLLGNTLASYIHLHFGSNPDLAPCFADQCRAWKG